MSDFGLGLRIAYDGSRYAGFQLQARQLSIQFEIERALKIFFRKEVRIHFSSRTDAGVHAYDQWVWIPQAWSWYEDLSTEHRKRCLHSLNAILPEDIKIWQLLKLSPDFSPKNSIEWKEYEYIVAMGPVLDPLLRNRAWWIRAPLKVKVIQRHLKKFMGEQDFVGFMKRPKNFKGSTIRKIFKAEVKAISSPAIRSLTILRFRFRGSGFLHNMVRNFVTDAVEVGRGRSLDEAGDLAPPGALCLTRSKVKSKYFEIISY